MGYCGRCKKDIPDEDCSCGYCNGCINDMAEEDREEPDGGAYREHQWG